MLSTKAMRHFKIATIESTTSEELRIKLLIEEARRLRRRRWYWVGLLSVVVAVGIAIGVSGANSPRTPGGVLNPDGSAFHLAPLTSTQLKSGLLDYLFPTDAHDLAAGWSFAGRVQMTGAMHQLACMSDSGFAAKIVATPSQLGGDNTVFPNVGELKSGTFFGTKAPKVERFSRPTPTSGSTSPTFDVARQHCGTVAFGRVNSLLQTGNLVGNWAGTLQTSIQQSAAFNRYQKGFASCVQHSGVNVTSIDAFFAYSDGQLRASSEISKTSHRLAALYATCVSPLERWRDQLRTVDRRRLIASHNTEISKLVKSVETYLRT
jgi:hypothetical protein